MTAFTDRLETDVAKIFATLWEKRIGQQVPEPEDVKLGNDAVLLKGTVLYADLVESTNLVSRYNPAFAAEIYKSYLECAARVIRRNGGDITSYDGDRIMAVFFGESPNTRAAKSALYINYCVEYIIKPALKLQYPDSDYIVRQAVGIDSSDLFVANTGIRGSHELVWVGRAANYAAKLCDIREENYTSWITADVYNVLNDQAKYYDGHLMWEEGVWKERTIKVYRSNWWLRP
jgi:class 3 adenylate cyclase